LNETLSRERRNRALAHYDAVARLGKVLASPVRLRLLDLLRQGSRTVEDLAAAADETVANSSRHLHQMRAAHLVRAEREGKHVRYRLADDEVSRAFGLLRGLAGTLLPEMQLLRAEMGGLDEATRDDLLARIAAGAVTLVDVRPEEEFEEGHLPGAVSIPLEELPRRTGEIPRDREVVACCRGPYCPMSRRAVEILSAAGFRARHLDLGAPDLRDRAIPVVSGPPRRPGRSSASRSTPIQKR
jgi:rhodanese-related sulfurtransferase/DNA-binding transcriptional ArsR family regulator